MVKVIFQFRKHWIEKGGIKLLLFMELEIWPIYNTQHPTPVSTSVGKRCGTWCPAHHTGRARHTRTHSTWPQSQSCQQLRHILAKGQSHLQNQRGPVADIGLCRPLHEEDRHFGFLKLLPAFRGNWGAHRQQTYGLGCAGMWYHKWTVGNPSLESWGAPLVSPQDLVPKAPPLHLPSEQPCREAHAESAAPPPVWSTAGAPLYTERERTLYHSSTSPSLWLCEQRMKRLCLSLRLELHKQINLLYGSYREDCIHQTVN